MNSKYYPFYLGVLMTFMSAAAIAEEDPAIDACRKAASEQAKGEIVEIELEKEEGVEMYEIDLQATDGSKWEFKCDKTGKIVEKEQELPNADHPAFATLKKIDEAEARKTALAAHPGIIEEVEYEIESDGTAVYEIDIKTGDGREMEVGIDAATGKIIKSEED
ncbi:MAG: PepSY domain-containing protein [Methylobacter sp.]|uniref:PepSY domain-containing protein n=1 Tax=Methylobacter sp. TaxID=2051955 RepID=UPI00258EADB7|nr:PepSY domain-containing protein [Methylobacter sp.]MCL7422631.1 PepSY domain-containing protein [Methylobacter sp.]